MAYTIPDEFGWELKIDSYMVGPDATLRPSSLLQLQQEVGERHFGGGGLGCEELLREGLVFVLTRLRTEIRRPPRLNETVRVETWHRQAKGAQFFRCYRVVTPQGESLVESVSAFTLVDPVEHKLLRPSVFDRFGITGQDRTVEHCPDPARIRLPEGLQPVGEHRVRWSEIDFNGHLNNTRYADIVCDYAPGGMDGRRVTGLEIGYHREARPGQPLTLSAADDGAAIWMRGTREDGPCFDARMTYIRDTDR